MEMCSFLATLYRVGLLAKQKDGTAREEEGGNEKRGSPGREERRTRHGCTPEGQYISTFCSLTIIVVGLSGV